MVVSQGKRRRDRVCACDVRLCIVIDIMSGTRRRWRAFRWSYVPTSEGYVTVSTVTYEMGIQDGVGDVRTSEK